MQNRQKKHENEKLRKNKVEMGNEEIRAELKKLNKIEAQITQIPSLELKIKKKFQK
jgi:hypothetical protein